MSELLRVRVVRPVILMITGMAYGLLFGVRICGKKGRPESPGWEKIRFFLF